MGKILTWKQTGMLFLAALQFCGMIANVLATRPQTNQRYVYVRTPPNHYRKRLIAKGTYLKTSVDVIVTDSQNALLAEEAILAERKFRGVDTAVPDFKSLSPGILGAATETRGTSVSELARSCRVLNWAMAIARQRGVRSPASTFINSPAARNSGMRCPFVAPVCDPDAIYRTADGTCNNLAHPLWGSAYIPLSRDLPAKYDRGIVHGLPRRDLPRQTGLNNVALPNPRWVSNIVHASSSSIKETWVTMLYTNFGQALSHDMTDTPMEAGTNGAKLDCCHEKLDTQRCAAIKIPSNDFFNQFGRKCMNFFRSTEVTDIDCRSGQREQLNIATSFIDGTQVYGRDKVEMAAVRGEEGLLKTSFGNQCPFQKHPNQKAFEMGINILKSGDEKMSESPGLVSSIVIWYREHNRIAKRLAEFPRFASLPDNVRSDKIFEEARKIVIALMQQVTYREYLPITVGPEAMTKYNLWPLSVGYYTGYNASVNPTLANSFATASMRFGHSMIRDEQSILDKNYAPTSKNVRLKDVFWRSGLHLSLETSFQRGALTDPSEVCDRHMGVDLRNHMFQTTESNGLDLSALNIQRGRDHGLPSYSDYRRSVSLSVPVEWSTHPRRGFKDMAPDTVNRFRNVYGNPADIDLWSGGVAEIPVPGGTAGPLFAELLSKQFSRLRDGDRFWYENQITGFRQDRLDSIRKISFAKVICNNLPDIQTIQPRAFLVPTSGGSNDRIPCSSIPDLDLELWR